MVAQPSGSERAPTAAQETLLATKVRVPTLRPDRVARPRLRDLLDEHPHRGLVLVCAPAGYGKTVLLAEWAQRGGRDVVWLSLDAGDNDPIRFWRHLLAAVDQVRPGTLARNPPPPASSGPRAFDTPATALINELAADPQGTDVLLVLDDYHLIETPAIHELADFVVHHHPPNLQLALSSRSDPPLSLARLRARDELTEVREADLRFTPDEAAALLERATALGELPDTAVTALATRTEGWAAGLQLAALSLRGHPDVTGFVSSFTGSHRHVLDYLSEEVLERQGEQLRSFLMDTAVLDKLSGPLCDALTGRTDGQAMLEQVEREGLFLIPLDDVRGWWRYHHLFADLLRARLGSEGDRAAVLHRAAARWHEQHELFDEAIHHNLAAGELDSAARLIEIHFDTAYNLGGEEATISRWLSALPEHVVRARPRLLLAQAQMAAMRGDADSMEPLTDAAERAATGPDDDPFRPSSGRPASLLVNVPALIALQRAYAAQLRSDPDATERHTTDALGLIGPDEAMLRSAANGFLAMDAWQRGQLGDAERALTSRLADQRSDVPTTITWWRYLLATIQRARGDLTAAARTCRAAVDWASAGTSRPAPAAGPPLVALAEVAYQRNELDAARQYLDEGIARCRQYVNSLPLAAGLVTLAWTCHALGDEVGARDSILDAEEFARGPFGLLNPLPAQAAKLHLRQGDVAAAERWVDSSGLSPDADPLYAHELGHLVRARVLLARDRPDEALALLDPLHAAAVAQRRTASTIEIAALRSLALDAAGVDDAGRAALAEAIELASVQGHVRVFTDEGAPMAQLLGRLIAADRAARTTPPRLLAHAARVHQSFAVGGAAGASASGAGALIDPLTARESEILGLMASGKSNQAIAAELFVSIDTVKKHVSHILDKLGAHNRTEAVARGRELGLTG